MDALGGFKNQDNTLYRYFPPGGSVLSRDTRAIPFVVSCLAFTLQFVHGLAVTLNSFRKRRTASGELLTMLTWKSRVRPGLCTNRYKWSVRIL
ncbi:hypothetical protein GALMADRAFT_238835 [Galerina marginata CBS 339.88]|uniref:Uncharacterized protein n=1 Tax=Galerina marginata (strain CBS 339.88) TaxID=685588 RepID=A0A067TIT7_GALM3|nr:hypothetical protein GALMADRAFT_238835 [Galerina marginata CBS 339.88]